MKLMPTNLFQFRAKRSVLGLDIGGFSVKGVELEEHNRQLVIRSAKNLKSSAEGILDEKELHAGIAQWLKQNHWHNCELSVGVPQYLTTTQVRDFPPSQSGSMERMVLYETKQLAGLSEESFINDYQIMEPKFGRGNPVLIGICRHSVVANKLDLLEGANVSVSELGMSSVALANSLFHCRKESLDLEAPQIILDIGLENSTFIVIAGGQILFINSLLFASQKYNQALSASHDISTEEAESQKLKSRLYAGFENSPIYQTTRFLENEMRHALEQWRAHDNSNLVNAEVARIWLSGGGALLNGLPEHLEEVFNCQAQRFGPVNPETGIEAPELNTAFGLALQGLGKSRISISLCPPQIKWTMERKKNIPYLVASIFLLLLLMASTLSAKYLTLNRSLELQEREMKKLEACKRIVPQLDKTLDTIRHLELMMLPLVEKGNGAVRFLEAIREIAKIKDSQHYFVYLADEASFQMGKFKKTPESDSKKTIHPKRELLDLFGFTPEHYESKNGKSGSESGINIAENTKSTVNMILLGFTIASSKKEHYRIVRNIQRRISESNLFGSSKNEIDILSDDELKGREDLIQPWLKLLNSSPAKRRQRQKRYRDFAFKIVFKQPEIKNFSPRIKSGK